MAEEEKKDAPEEAQEESKDAPADDVASLPAPDFLVFISGVAAQVLMQLGEIENPMTKKTEPDLPAAKYSIDLIEMLKDKTEGNRTDDETRYIETVLYDLRMRYVKASETK